MEEKVRNLCNIIRQTAFEIHCCLQRDRALFLPRFPSKLCHPERSESASAVEGPSGRRQPNVPCKLDVEPESGDASGGGRSFGCARGLAALRMTEF